MSSRRLIWCVLPLLTLGARAQEEVEEPPPPPPPETRSTTEQATQPEPDPATPRERGRRGQGRGRGQGPGGRDKQEFELPEFTPVAAPPLSGLEGKQYFWFCIYPHFVVQFDPATDKIVKRLQLANGMFWNTTLTHDRKRLLVVTDQQRTIEVVDFASASLVGTHSFQEEGYILRVRSVREMPGGRHWLVQTDRVKQEIDRYSFEKSQYLLYDSAEKKTLRKLDKLPEQWGRSARLSADGTHWLTSDRDGNLLFLGARKFEELAKIDLRTPRFFGAGPIRLGSTDLLDGRDPKRALMVFTSTDPVEKRRTNWGTVEIDLENKRIGKVTEWGPSVSSRGLRIAYSKRVGAMMSGRRDDKSHLQLYDLTTGERIAEAYEQFRPRRSLVAIAPDGDKVYIGTAGSDFEVFDADLKRLGDVELDGEIWGRIFVIDA